jgi:hypothetical protein
MDNRYEGGFVDFTEVTNLIEVKLKMKPDFTFLRKLLNSKKKKKKEKKKKKRKKENFWSKTDGVRLKQISLDFYKLTRGSMNCQH